MDDRKSCPKVRRISHALHQESVSNHLMSLTSMETYRKHVVPSQKRRQNSKDTSSRLQRTTRRRRRKRKLLRQRETQESHIQNDKQARKRQRRPERQQCAKRRENEPAPEIQCKHSTKTARPRRLIRITLHDPETRREYDGERDPEAAVGG